MNQSRRVVVQPGINEVNIGFIDKQQAFQVGRKFPQLILVHQVAGGGMRVDQQSQFNARCIHLGSEVLRQLPLFRLEWDRYHRTILYGCQRLVE